MYQQLYKKHNDSI